MESAAACLLASALPPSPLCIPSDHRFGVFDVLKQTWHPTYLYFQKHLVQWIKHLALCHMLLSYLDDHDEIVTAWFVFDPKHNRKEMRWHCETVALAARKLWLGCSFLENVLRHHFTPIPALVNIDLLNSINVNILTWKQKHTNKECSNEWNWKTLIFPESWGEEDLTRGQGTNRC